jgi:hypothetical protein
MAYVIIRRVDAAYLLGSPPQAELDAIGPGVRADAEMEVPLDTLINGKRVRDFKYGVTKITVAQAKKIIDAGSA